MTPPRSAFSACPSEGRRQWPGKAGSTASAGSGQRPAFLGALESISELSHS